MKLMTTQRLNLKSMLQSEPHIPLALLHHMPYCDIMKPLHRSTPRSPGNYCEFNPNQVSSPKGEGSPKTTKLGNRTTQGCYRIPLFAPACRPASKSGPSMVCFVHFDLEMYFAPQQRTLFRHLNFQKRSGAEVFCAFWLANVLRATTAYTFSTSQLPKVVRTWGVLNLLTWKCASSHNGVQFFISPLASWLRTRRFSEPTFRPSRATNHWKNTVFRDFPTFSRICIFCPLTLSLLLFSLLIFLFSLPLPYSAFHLSILSEVWLLNFLRWIYGWFMYCYTIVVWIYQLSTLDIISYHIQPIFHVGAGCSSSPQVLETLQSIYIYNIYIYTIYGVILMDWRPLPRQCSSRPKTRLHEVCPQPLWIVVSPGSCKTGGHRGHHLGIFAG